MTSLIQKIKARYGRRHRSAVASVIGGVIVFAILFSVGYAYFLTAQQDYKSIQNSSISASQEIFSVTGSLTTGNVSVIIKNSGPITITIESIVTVNETSGTQYGKTYLLDNTSNYHTTHGGWEIPFSLNPQTTSNIINTTVPLGQSSFLIEAITSRGTIATATVSNQPALASQLALQALTSGSLGDLYLAFNSYTYYTITSHSSSPNCPGSSQNPSYSNYCLQTSAGNTGPAFDIPATVSGNIAFSINMTSLNSQQADVILDQFSLMYQTSTYGNGHVNLNWYYITTVGAPSNGYIPILQNYQLQVLSYNVPKTLYFIASTCVTASNGPTSENSQCGSATNFNGVQGHGSVANVFLLSNGWELASGSYQITQGHLNSLVYSGTGLDVNYGQNSPYVSTLYE